MAIAQVGIPRTRITDVVGLTAVPIVLVLVHFLLPTPIKELLVFRFHDPTLTTAWTATLIHQDVSHLASNLLGYSIGVLPSYFFFILLGQRRRFWITASLVFLVTPFVTTAIDYWFLHLRWDLMADGATSRGFSGVVTAFGGMLLAILTLFLATEYNKLRAGHAAGMIVLVGLGLAGNEVAALTPSLLVLLSIGLLACLSGIVPRNLLFAGSDWLAVWRQNSENIVYATYSGIVVCLFMLTFIPSTSDAGMFSNAIAHATGFTCGLVLTFVVSIEE